MIESERTKSGSHYYRKPGLLGKNEGAEIAKNREILENAKKIMERAIAKGLAKHAEK